jgi:LPXTG-site transpeptidase (sortase) family protein
MADLNSKFGNKKYLRWLAGAILLLTGIYLIILFSAPAMTNFPVFTPNSIKYNANDDYNDTRNRIQIPKINIEVPYYTGGTESLEKGAWHRMPQNGDPKNGGNFVLAAHRLEIGWTPGQTIRKSPFYNIDKLTVGDDIYIFYENNKYTYKVNKIFQVEPTALQIEDRSADNKLTLYSCTLKGANDGRVVIEARQL